MASLSEGTVVGVVTFTLTDKGQFGILVDSPHDREQVAQWCDMAASELTEAERPRDADTWGSERRRRKRA